MKKHTRIKYETPTLNLILVEMEQGIAASSVTITPPDGSLVIQEEWQVDDDVTRTIEW